MADAQTPVLTNEQILVLASAHTCSVSHPTRYVLDTLPFARAILAAQAPAQPDRAVMQQWLESLEAGRDALAEEANQFHAAMRGYKPKQHAQLDANVTKADAAIASLRAALSTTMEKPHG